MADSLLCRMCGSGLPSAPLLSYPNSPQSAQGFLESREQDDQVVDLHIYQCESCGLVQHALSPVSYFRDVIRAIAFSPEMGEFRRAQLARWIEKFNLSGKRLIEVGCGRGEYLELLGQSGARSLFGIENAHSSVDAAKAQGFDVRPAYLTPDFSNPWPEPFEAFAIFSFMEHWPDLKGSLGGLRSVLVDGAVGLIEVPNFEFILANGLYSEFTTDHIHYFDQQTLRMALELNGFDVLSIKKVWHDYILSAQVRKRTFLKTESFNTKRQRIVSDLHSFTDRFKLGRIVIWGAGHQALAVMSMAQLQDRVSHVVDSAGFKQHKYTPGTRLLIKSPESLRVDMPHAIIVMCAAYSDEVARTIAEQYPFIDHVAILREGQLEIVKDVP